MSGRSCDDCERYQYDDKLDRLGPLIRLDGGEPMKRPVGIGTPCHMCPKIPDDAREKRREFAIEPSERSREAYWHWRTCKAVGRFPDDEIVARNAALIEDVREAAERAMSGEAATLVALLLKAGK